MNIMLGYEFQALSFGGITTRSELEEEEGQD